MNAVEEYNEVSERYEFMKKNRDDIVETEKKLISIIDRLENLMKTQFAEQFAVIRQNFSEVFVEMFGGGTAELKLSDTSDVLNSGIDIIVQPPGKAVQNMMLLSGGEKALTAMALLFAILKMKPSPFCILDEIEAALDDANVNRYAEYLSHFTDSTQFVVITHRKGTMEASDILYGVTMQEQGVSKLVSVKFDNNENTESNTKLMEEK
jgi:chromosome segregation protein